MGIMKPQFPAVNESVTMAEHGLWGWQVLPDGNKPVREDQGTRSWRPLDIPAQIFFPDLMLKSVLHKAEPCSQVLQ